MGQKRAWERALPGQSLVAAMRDPAFYPLRPEEILHKETHISHVFLAGGLVYKIKKAVRFPFLDFSTLQRRRHFLTAELRLNRRLAPEMYLGVVPIFRNDRGWTLEGGGKPAEYALLMRRLPVERMLDSLLGRREATVVMMEQLADRIAAFHARAERVKAPPEEHRRAARSDWDKNLDELEPLMDDAGRDDLRAVAEHGREFLEKNAGLIARRAGGGWIRDVHGDLHAEHVCFAAEGIQIFDCIEFSDELRQCDLASEIAFLLMDLAVRGGEALVGPFLHRYLRNVSDADMPALLPFYECYRALIRAKVHALRTGDWNPEAARYFDFALRFQWRRFGPFLLLASGFTGSGKSTLARALAARIGAPVINSDEVRKSLAGTRGREVVGWSQGIYSRAMTGRTYDEMAREAEALLEANRCVIVDATFGQREQRAKFIHLAQRRDVPLLIVRCISSDAVSAERLRARAVAGKDISDGRWEIYVAQKGAFESMEEIDAAARLDLCTEASVQSLVREVETFLRQRLKAREKQRR